MIRAVYRDGKIQALDGIPADWREGDELVVDAVECEETPESFEEWVAELNEAAAGISDEEHDRFMKALDEVERESKELGRREMEKSKYIFPDTDDEVSREAG